MSEDLDDIVENLREPSAWARIAFMLGFSIVLYMVIIPLTLLLTLAQALFSVFTGEDNDNLRNFGASLLAYISQVVRFLTFNSEARPFPFSDFPEWDGAIEAEKEEKESNAKPAAADSSAGNESAAVDKPAVKKTAKRKPASKKTAKKATKKAKKKTSKKAAKPAKEQASGSDKADEKAESDETKE